jgi:CheY-like chemotaxis protein
MHHVPFSMLWERSKMPNATVNLLVVDDDAALRKTLSHILGAFGHHVRCAADGFAALSEIRLAIPDIILSDLNMPGMSGFEFLSVVRRRFPAIRVIAMSSAFPVDGLPPGVVADAFYQKGNNLATLFHIMETLTGPQQPPSFHHASTPAPIWVERNGHDTSGGAFVMLTCPECLRTFPQVFADAPSPVHETACIYCNSRFHYAIVQPTEPAPRKAADPKKASSRYLPPEQQARESI